MTAKCVLTIWELSWYQRLDLEIRRKVLRCPHNCKTGYFTPKIGQERFSANVQITKTTGADCVVQKCCFLTLIQKFEIFSPYLLFSLLSTDESRSIGDRESYLVLSIFFLLFMRYRWMCQRNSQLYQWKSYLRKYTWLLQVHVQVWLSWRRGELLNSRRQVFNEFLWAWDDICNKVSASLKRLLSFGWLKQRSFGLR